MNIKQEKEVQPTSSGTSKDKTATPKKYCDRQFKIQLARALKANLGEADNFHKIKS